MGLRAKIFVLYLLCVARASEVQSEESAEFGALAHVDDLLRIPIPREADGVDGQATETPRDKRALGLLLSGLAQIFGYTVTPIQFASLPNPNVTAPAASKAVDVRQQTASSQPKNATVPRQQETIRFTGVLNLGNNSDILGHLRQYEQIFHGRRGNATTTARPSMPPAKVPVDPRTSSPTRPPLLAPFFVKIPLPIAPELLPATMSLEELGLSHLSAPVSMSGSSESTEAPVRKEQEMVYRSNEDTERYTVEEKDIYDEKDVRKPMGKYTHQLYVDEPSRDKQQNDRRNELLRKQEERVKKLEQQEEERNRDKGARYNEEEMKERHRNREKEIAGRNRDQASSKHESTEERKPARDDEEDEGSAERYEEYASQENLSGESSKEPSKEAKGQSEEYPSYDDDSNRQFNGYKRPGDLNKYVEGGYNRQLPIGDYFHENNPEVIRDSYGEVLDNKKLEDDRIAAYISMFKHPYVEADDSQRARPEDASREEIGGGETSAEDDGYDEHLARLQKLRDEYALPENKYEEYDLNAESEEDRSDRQSGGVQNRTTTGSRTPRPGRLRDKEDERGRRPSGPSRDERLQENARSREEDDFARYMPLVVPVRYIDANDRVQQATTRQLNYKEADESTDGRLSEDNAAPTRTVLVESLVPQIGLPERPRQLHEGEHKELQVWPPPFDYAFDTTEPANSVVPPDYYPQNYAPKYYQHVVKGVAAQDARDKSSEQPSGYLVVVGNPEYPYRHPYNIYYFPNEAINPRSQVPRPSAEVTRPLDQVYVAQQSANQQIVQARPNSTEYNRNGTTNTPRDYYYQSQKVPANDLDRYKYIHGERTAQVEDPISIEVRSQIPNAENWSNRIYRPQSPGNTAEVQSPRPVFAQLQNIKPSSQRTQNGPPERPRHSRLRRQKSPPAKEDRREDKEEAKTPRLEETDPPPIPESKPFDDPQSAHDFFGFSKDDYSFGSESGDATKVAEENGKTAGESDVFVAPEPAAYHHDDESIVKHADEPENDTEKAKVREYRNKVATLRVSERRQLKPNGPIHYVDFIRNL
ncbi:PREDICTED: uncharacterized protein LOC105570205 [Vollenhovia emeryi]|uniref:uncharacterized protein LOC105570205 n=1 Tax=Vollenhovia emeryi TaxID=411798 RepID=UPI0005F56008|nr:PREDICTED: uncharacterized protein LOC105570205 [Vollenhovia emeryi]